MRSLCTNAILTEHQPTPYTIPVALITCPQSVAQSLDELRPEGWVYHHKSGDSVDHVLRPSGCACGHIGRACLAALCAPTLVLPLMFPREQAAVIFLNRL